MLPDDWVHLVRMDSHPLTMATLGGVRTHDETVSYVLRRNARCGNAQGDHGNRDLAGRLRDSARVTPERSLGASGPTP